MGKSHYEIAKNEIKNNNFQKAVNALNKAIEKEPNNPTYYSDRGVCYYHLEMKEQALTDMNKSVELDPEYSYRYSSRAYIKDSMGDVKGAVEDYEIAVKLDSEDAVAYNNLGLLQEKLGYMQQSKSNFEKADGLAKMLEESGIEYNNELKPTNLQKEIDKENKNLTTKKVMFSIFKSKENFKEFIQFIKNGFKK
jgi:Flp pilus assembly protein TadD